MRGWYALVILAVCAVGFFAACGDSLEDELEACQERCERINQDGSDGRICLGCFPTTAKMSASPARISADLKHEVVEQEADVDEDGLLDLVIATSADETVSVLLGRSTDGSQTWQHFAAGRRPEAMHTADMDGDGIVDLVISNSDSEEISVLFGHGDGNFGPGQHWHQSSR